MPRIFVLPPELASQIAAGEVVERPASVVKELVENALDAGATRCDIAIEGGGIARITVVDDGSGMDEADARLALERHATSKVSMLADLERLVTYGFRGEALPSIASVSRLLLRTRARDSDTGFEVALESGGPPSVRPAGVAPGTEVLVTDLFYNVPARRKFLRSTGTESGHVSDVVEAAALSRPEVTFTLMRDGRKVRDFLRVKTREERVRQVEHEDELAPCRGERGPLRVEAFLSRPEAARAGAGGLTLVVNGRTVRDRALQVAIAQAYGSVLERGRYPRGVVYLDLPPELVDVNVHPQKSEVRFADPRAANDAVYGILSRALATAFSLPPAQRGAALRGRPFGAVLPPLSPGGGAVAAPALASDTLLTQAASGFISGPEPDEPPEARAVLTVREPLAPGRADVHWSSLRFVAQLRQTFLVCEGDDGLYLLDQHAAAERVTFTRLRRDYQSRAVPAQALLFPTVLEVTAAEAEIVERSSKEIAEVGLDVRVRGPESVSIHAVPKLLQRGSPERLLRDLLSEVSRGGGRGFSDAVDLALATMACHGSIRAGDALSPNEVKALLTALDHADFAGHCPHGRPIVSVLSWVELERKVGRR
jgi:DNA mismatch repair protein MutL